MQANEQFPLGIPQQSKIENSWVFRSSARLHSLYIHVNVTIKQLDLFLPLNICTETDLAICCQALRHIDSLSVQRSESRKKT